MRQLGPDVAKIAALIGDPVRARMLFELLGAHEFSASELAYRAQASPQAASGHLSKLVAGGLLQARDAGRQRFFRLASPEVAHAIETIASIAPATPVVSLQQHTAMQRLREARSCYDHLAGKLGVRVTDALVTRNALTLNEREFTLTPQGERFLRSFGVDVEAARSGRRTFARACVDWTERRPHLAGALGAALLAGVLEAGWLERARQDRALRLTDLGRREFARLFSLSFDD